MIRCDYCIHHRIYYEEDGTNDGCNCNNDKADNENLDYHVCDEYDNSEKETSCPYYNMDEKFKD